MIVIARVQRGWLRRAVRLLRVSRLVAYVCITLAGTASMVWPPVAMQNATGQAGVVAYVWAGLLTVAAAFCAWGIGTDQWIGEYVGLVPLGMSTLVFTVSTLSRGQVGVSGGVFLFGFFWILVTRWQEVALLRVEASRAAAERECDP